MRKLLLALVTMLVVAVTVSANINGNKSDVGIQYLCIVKKVYIDDMLLESDKMKNTKIGFTRYGKTKIVDNGTHDIYKYKLSLTSKQNKKIDLYKNGTNDSIVLYDSEQIITLKDSTRAKYSRGIFTVYTKSENDDIIKIKMQSDCIRTIK